MEYFEIGPFMFAYDPDDHRLVATEGDWEVWVSQSDNLERAKVAAARWATEKFSNWSRDAFNLVT